MAQLSEIVALFKKQQGQKNMPGRPGARTNYRAPVMKGTVRGTSGVLGSKTFQGRNAQAGGQKELETLNSPIFKAFLSKTMPMTPVSDYFAKGGW